METPNPTASPQLPGSPAGTPQTPGASPMAAPGAGAGNKVAMMAILKQIVQGLYKVLGTLPAGDKDYDDVLKALSLLSKIVGKSGEENEKASAIQKMAIQAMNNPLKSASPVGVAQQGAGPAA